MMKYITYLIILFAFNYNGLSSLSIVKDSNYLLSYSNKIFTESKVFATYSKADVQWLNGSWVASMRCSFDDENAEVTWHFQEIASDGTAAIRKIDDQFASRVQLTSTLVLPNITAENAGSYLCLIALPSGYSNQTFFLNAEPVINDGHDTEIFVSMRDSVSIDCTSYIGSQLYWRLPLLKSFYDLSESSYDGEINSTITLSFLAKFNQSSDYYQCCSQSSSGFPSYCKTFSVVITDAPIEVSLAIQIGSAINKCRLTCAFNSYPIVNNESVTFSSKVMGSDWTVITTYLDYSVEKIGNYTLRASMIIAPNPTNLCGSGDSLSCSASNGDTSGTATLNNIGSGYYFAPIPDYSETFGRLSFDGGSYSAVLRCAFSANSDPSITWKRQAIDGPSDGWEDIKNGSRFEINKIELQTLTYISLLTISNYGETDNANYFCVAYNQMGEAISAIIQPKITIDEVELELISSSLIVFPEDEIEVKCSASSYPPPKIIWNIIAEFDLDYTIELITDWKSGNTSSIIQFEADYNNSFVSIECMAYNELYADEVYSNQLTIDINHEPEIINTKTCPENFKSNCTLECEVQISIAQNLLEWEWRYFIDSPFEFVTITDGASIKKISLYKWRLQLTIESYNAWNYECWAFLSLNETIMDSYINISSTFKLNPIEEYLELGDTCSNNQDCATLNSNCVDQECQCSSPCDIPLDDNPLTLECLSAVAPGGDCLISAQCEEGDLNYYCDLSRICKCGGMVVSIASIGKDECIKKVEFGGTCRYDEECAMADTNSCCYSQICGCVSDYTYDDYSKLCILNSENMSTAAIVIITVTCCFLVLIAVTFTVAFIKRRRRKKSPKTMNRNRSEVISEISGVPYSQQKHSKNIPSIEISEDDDSDCSSTKNSSKTVNVPKIIEKPVNGGVVNTFSSPVSTPNDDLNVVEAIASHHSIAENGNNESAIPIKEVTTEDSIDNLPTPDSYQTKSIQSANEDTLQNIQNENVNHKENNDREDSTENSSTVKVY